MLVKVSWGFCLFSKKCLDTLLCECGKPHKCKEEGGLVIDHCAPEAESSADWQSMRLRGLLEMQVLEPCSKAIK